MFRNNATLELVAMIFLAAGIVCAVGSLLPARPQAAPAANVAPVLPAGQSGQPAAPAGAQNGDAVPADSAVPPTAGPSPEGNGDLVEAAVEPTDLKVRLPALSLSLAAYGSPPADFNGNGDLPAVPDGTVLHVVGLVARVEEGRITMRLLKVELEPGLYFYVPFMRDGAPVVLGTTMASFDAIVLGGNN